MKNKGFIAILIGVLLIVSGVIVYSNHNFLQDKVEKQDQVSNQEKPVVVGNDTSFGEAVNVFGLNLFKNLKSDYEYKNIFYSPYSVFTALAMTYEGAMGLTASEMKEVLSIEKSNESFHQYMQYLYDYLNQNSEYTVNTANALWVRENFNLLHDYLDVIEEFYHGNATEIDFSNPKLASQIINQWVENQTNNLIKNLVPASVIGPLTMLILTNAIYFKGPWQVQFEEVNTTDRDFDLSAGGIIEVPTMCIVDTYDEFMYTENDKLQILELPYSGDEISMIILLPKDDFSTSDIIESIGNQKIIDWTESMNEREVDIYLPKFKFDTEYDLNEKLIDMGMENAFSTAADFSGITGGKDLMIDKVLHKAFIEVNEEGTEAAAATAVVMRLTAVDGGDTNSRVVFDADHPFLFIIRHKETGTILFIGEVQNPIE